MPLLKNKFICPHCYSQFRNPKDRQKGSYLVLIVLLLLLIVPGLIYLAWMTGATEKVCPKCGQPGVIKLDTPKGKILANQTEAAGV